MSFLIHDALHQDCALQQPLSGLELRYNYVQTVSKQIYRTEAHQTSGLGTEIWGSRAPLSSDKNPFLPMTSVFKHSRHVYVVTLARRRLDLKSSWRFACFVVSGDPTGAVAARLPEDSCVNEAHCAPREYMVLCTSFGTKGVRADDTVRHYSLTILEKATLKFSVSFHNRYKISCDEKRLFLFHHRVLSFILLHLLTKQHFPSLWWMCVGVHWVPLLPSKSWAYWGNPAARSQSHASFASISGKKRE